jgi:hypothetical protein
MYIISTIKKAKKNKHKLGKHGGTKENLLSRYRTYLIKPVIYYFEPVDDCDTVEKQVLARLNKYRMLSDNGRMLEWVKVDLEHIIFVINKVIEENNVARLPNFKIFKCKNQENVNVVNYAKQTPHKNINVPIFTCEHCKKEFTLKTNLQRHLNRKTTCYERKDRLTCKTCNVVFTRLGSLNEHMKTNKHINNLTKIVDDKNIKVSGGTNISTINAINVVPFCKEKLDSLTDEQKKQFLSQTKMSIRELVKLLHLNPNLPQNHNVYISNMRSKYGHIYDGEQWIVKDANDIMDDFLEKKCNDIEELLKQYEKSLPENVTQTLKEMVDNLAYDEESGDPDGKEKKIFKKRVFEEVRLMLYNYKHIPLATRQHSAKLL